MITDPLPSPGRRVGFFSGDRGKEEADMAFVVGKIESVKRRVVFELPADSGKKPEKADFVAEFCYHDADKIKDRQKSMQDLIERVHREVALSRKDPEYEPDIPEADFKEEYIREDLLNLDGCMDEDGNELEFGPDLVDAVLRDRSSRMALIDTWDELNSGRSDAKKRKN